VLERLHKRLSFQLANASANGGYTIANAEYAGGNTGTRSRPSRTRGADRNTSMPYVLRHLGFVNLVHAGRNLGSHA